MVNKSRLPPFTPRRLHQFSTVYLLSLSLSLETITIVFSLYNLLDQIPFSPSLHAFLLFWKHFLELIFSKIAIYSLLDPKRWDDLKFASSERNHFGYALSVRACARVRVWIWAAMALSGMRGLSVFISDIRNCQNKEQERLRVDKELGNVRTRFKNEKVRVSIFRFHLYRTYAFD